MEKKDANYSSTFTLDNFQSTNSLTPNEIKNGIGTKISIKDIEYKPYEHRNLEHPNTFSGALTHIVKSSLGTGILAVPMAFKHAGLIEGFIGTFLVGLLCTHTIQILVEASHKMCKVDKVPSLGFAETAHAVFKYGPAPLRPWSNFALLFVDIALVLTYFVGIAVYLVFIGDSVKQILDNYYPNNDITKLYIMLAVMGLLLIFCQIRPLKFLVPFSALANVTMIIAFGITFYYMTSITISGKIEESSPAKGFGGVPKFLVTVIFALEGIGSIMPVENSMMKPEFIGCPGVLNVGMTIVVFLFASMGFFGYYVFGETTQASITYNLPKEDLAMFARGCISAAVFFTYMLQFYVPMEISWRYMQKYFAMKHYNIVQITWRAISVAFVTVIAISVPDLDTIIDIVGSVAFSILGLLIPAVLDILVNWNYGFGPLKWKLFKNIFIILLGSFVLVFGTYYAIGNLLNKK